MSDIDIIKNNSAINGGMLQFTGLDERQPYALGNRVYLYKKECKNCGPLEDKNIKITSGINDGYEWTAPYCGICLAWLPAIPKDEYLAQKSKQ